MRFAPLSIGLTIFAFAILGLSSSATLAMGHVGLGSHSTSDIKSHCDAAGGSYYNSGGVYGCFGPGGDVTCSGKNGKCFGSCSKCGSAARLSGKGGVAGFLKSPTTGLLKETSGGTKAGPIKTNVPGTANPNLTTRGSNTTLKKQDSNMMGR
jgi:hypothetical protein